MWKRSRFVVRFFRFTAVSWDLEENQGLWWGCSEVLWFTTVSWDVEENQGLWWGSFGLPPYNRPFCIHLNMSKVKDLFVCFWFFVQHENFSHIWRRHHNGWRAANSDPCSALMVIEHWMFMWYSDRQDESIWVFKKIKYSLFKQSYKCQIIGNETKHSYYYMYIHKEVVTWRSRLEWVFSNPDLSWETNKRGGPSNGTV